MRGQTNQYQKQLVGVSFVFTKKGLLPMNHQQSIAEKFAENKKWLETECKKIGLEETNKVAGDTVKQVESRLTASRMFASQQRSQQRS